MTARTFGQKTQSPRQTSEPTRSPRSTRRATFFASDFGVGALIWAPEGLCALVFPEPHADAEVLEARLSGQGISRTADSSKSDPRVPAFVGRALERIHALLKGEPAHFDDLPLAHDVEAPFFTRVFEVVRAIPFGQTLSYAQVATAAGSPQAVRAVGQAMARNPLPLIIPCHRVLASQENIGGFSAGEGVASKVRLLTLEGSLPAPHAFLARVDARLAKVIAAVGPFPLTCNARGDAFVSLARAIISQQLSTAAARTI